MKTLILLLLTMTPLLGSEFITFRSDEGSESTYRKYHLTVTSGVEAILNSEGEYDHTSYVKIYVKDLDKMFPELLKMHEDIFYMIYFERKGMKYTALKGSGPFAQKSSSSSTHKTLITDIELKNCQIILERLLTLKFIPKPGENTDKETPRRNPNQQRNRE